MHRNTPIQHDQFIFNCIVTLNIHSNFIFNEMHRVLLLWHTKDHSVNLLLKINSAEMTCVVLFLYWPILTKCFAVAQEGMLILRQLYFLTFKKYIHI